MITLKRTTGLSPNKINSSFVNFIETIRTFNLPRGRPCLDSPIPKKNKNKNKNRDRNKNKENCNKKKDNGND